MSNSITLTNNLKTVKLRDFRENAQKYIDAIGRGHSFTVIKRSTPVFSIVPPIIDEFGDEGNWETVVDFEKDGITVEEFMKMLRDSQNERQNK
jgi:hypothetical protein